MPTITIKSLLPGGAGLKCLHALGFSVIAMFLVTACSEEQASSTDSDAPSADELAGVCDHVLGQYGYAYGVIETLCTGETGTDGSAEDGAAEACDLVLEAYPYAHRGLVRDGVCS